MDRTKTSTQAYKIKTGGNTEKPVYLTDVYLAPLLY